MLGADGAGNCSSGGPGGATGADRTLGAASPSPPLPTPSAFYIANYEAARQSAYLAPRDARAVRQHRALDALALVRHLPCAAASRALVRRDGPRIAALFRSPWLPVWAELRGGMVLLYDHDPASVASTSVTSASPAAPAPAARGAAPCGPPSRTRLAPRPPSTSASASRRSRRDELRASASLGKHVSRRAQSVDNHTCCDSLSTSNSPVTATPSRPTSAKVLLASRGNLRAKASGYNQVARTSSAPGSSAYYAETHGAELDSRSSEAGTVHTSTSTPTTTNNFNGLDPRCVFVVSDAVVDVTNTATYTQITLRRPDGISLCLRLASYSVSQMWCVALATATAPYRTVSLSDFAQISPIGRGASGKVFLVRDSNTEDRLALKIIPKHHAFRSSLTFQHVLNERLVLEDMVGEPFLVQLRYAFQSESYLYLATEFYDGGDVFSLLQANSGRLAERHAVRLIGEVILALQALHKRNIVYRDLKPENVVLDGKGHVRLVDFGLAKILKSDESLLTQTICGTTAYAAPEMLQSQSYSLGLDMWCLGIFVYHVLCGRPPYNFKNRSMEEMEEMQRSRVIRFSSSLSRESISLIKSLLQTDPSYRPSLEQIRRHPFFRNIDWHSLARKDPHPDNLAYLVSGNGAQPSHPHIRLSPVSNAGLPFVPSAGANGDLTVPPTSAVGNYPTPSQLYSEMTQQQSVPSAVHPARLGLNISADVAPGGSPIFRPFGMNGHAQQHDTGSSLHTNSSDAGFNVEEGIVDDEASMLDEYLLRNINKEEWRNVSFSQEGEDVLTVTHEFPTLLRSKTAIHIETIAIAGWAWASKSYVQCQNERSTLAKHADEVLVPPSPLLGRASLQERMKKGSRRRRSLDDRSGASNAAVHRSGGLFDVGPDRQLDLRLAQQRYGTRGGGLSTPVGSAGNGRRSLDGSPMMNARRSYWDAASLGSNVKMQSLDSSSVSDCDGPMKKSPMQFAVSHSFQESLVDPDANVRTPQVGCANQLSIAHGKPPTSSEASYGRSQRVIHTSSASEAPFVPPTQEGPVGVRRRSALMNSELRRDMIRSNLMSDPLGDPCRGIPTEHARHESSGLSARRVLSGLKR
jgi:serine/threonine protein kinase